MNSIYSLTLAVLLAMFVSIQPRCGAAQETESESVEAQLAEARGNAEAAKDRYDTMVRLRSSGSASRWEVERANFQRKVALLRFGILDQPKKKEMYELRIAEVTFKFTSDRVETFRRSAENRGISKLDFRRLETSRDIAKLRLDAKKNGEQVNFYSFKIAVAEYELAQEEYDSVNRLYRKGAVSKTAFETAKSKRRQAKTKLDARKKKLGARAQVLNLKT